MKSAVKKIAMILVIVMIVNCFTGCVEVAEALVAGVTPYFLAAFAVCAAIAGVIAIIKVTNELSGKQPRRANPYLYEDSTLTTTISSLHKEDIDSLTETFYSLPENELNLFIGRLNSMSKKETISLIESMNSFSVQELAAIVKTFNSMQETEIAYSLESLNSLPKTVSLAGIVKSINADVSGEKAPAAQSLRN